MIDARETARKLVLNAARYSGAASAARPWLAGRGAILMLHRVTDAATSPMGLHRHLAIRPSFLDAVLTDLRRQRIAVVSLDEAIEHLSSSNGGRVVAITSDDAYLDNFDEALPVFEAHDAPFTIYVAPGLTNGDVLPWWEVLEDLVARRDVVYLPTPNGMMALDCADMPAKLLAARRLFDHLTRDVPEEAQQKLLASVGVTARPSGGGRLFMDWNELRILARHRLATIGAHTIHHYNLARLSAEAARQEMADSATVIDIETGVRPSHFAYPYGYPGAAGTREVEIARDLGFASAVTTRHGVLQPGHVAHLHALPRISVNGNYQRLGYMRTLLSGFTTPLSNSGRRLVTI
jgi:peptidoglycan/xylan/chitin deacetylase (PgdA/CDA1 family)